MGSFSKPGGSDHTVDDTATLTNKTIDGDDNTVQDLPVTALKNGTDGELITWGSDAVATTVAAGTSTQVLTSNGAGAAPTFQAASGGSGAWSFISSQTASSSSEITFTGLSSTHSKYKILITGVSPASDQSVFNIRTSTDGGSTYDTTGGDYSWISRYSSSGGTLTTDNSSSASAINITSSVGAGNASNETGNLELSIINPSATTYTFIEHRFSFLDNTGVIRQGIGTGVRLSAADVDAVEIKYNSGNIAAGIFTLYGLSAT